MLSETPIEPQAMSDEKDHSVPAAITDIGCERELNEDRYAVIDSVPGRAWIVCDGMGGALGGELAAQLAIDAIRRALDSRDFESSEEAIKSAIEEANRIIVLRRQNPAFSSMGTTVVGALIKGEQVVISHAGDSRAYIVRGSEVEQITTDHTYVQDLVDRGAITEEEALTHPQSHVLTKCLGADPRIELKTETFWLWDSDEDEVDDKLFLCSDGLYSLVSDQEIGDVVSRLSPQEACVHLVELAKSRGGYDNITVAILPFAGCLKKEMSEKARRLTNEQKLSISQVQRAVSLRPRLSVGQKIALMTLLLILGSLVASLVVLYNFAN